MINNLSLTGRIAQKIKVFENPNNTVGGFTLAVQRLFKNKNGEHDADFIRIVAFNKVAETIKNYTEQGMLVGIEGRVQTSNYENKHGERIYTTDIIANRVIFLETKEQVRQRRERKNNKDEVTDENYYRAEDIPPEITEDDLPFK